MRDTTHDAYTSVLEIFSFVFALLAWVQWVDIPWAGSEFGWVLNDDVKWIGVLLLLLRRDM